MATIPIDDKVLVKLNEFDGLRESDLDDFDVDPVLAPLRRPTAPTAPAAPAAPAGPSAPPHKRARNKITDVVPVDMLSAADDTSSEVVLLGKGSYSNVYKCTLAAYGEIALKKYTCDLLEHSRYFSVFFRDYWIHQTANQTRTVVPVKFLMIQPRLGEGELSLAGSLGLELGDCSLRSFMKKNVFYFHDRDNFVDLIAKLHEVYHEFRDVCLQNPMSTSGHHDMKTDNIIVYKDPATGQNRYKLTDFSLTQLAPDFRLKSFEVCTLWYRSPELCAHDKNYSYAADYWSIGMILLDVLTGLSMFDDETSTGHVLQKSMMIFGYPDTRIRFSTSFPTNAMPEKLVGKLPKPWSTMTVLERVWWNRPLAECTMPDWWSEPAIDEVLRGLLNLDYVVRKFSLKPLGLREYEGRSYPVLRLSEYRLSDRPLPPSCVALARYVLQNRDFMHGYSTVWLMVLELVDRMDYRPSKADVMALFVMAILRTEDSYCDLLEVIEVLRTFLFEDSTTEDQHLCDDDKLFMESLCCSLSRLMDRFPLNYSVVSKYRSPSSWKKDSLNSVFARYIPSFEGVSDAFLDLAA